MTEEKGWLIEVNTGSVPVYLMVCGTDKENAYKVDGAFQWTPTAFYALRFARKEDACLFLGAFIRMASDLPYKCTMRNLRAADDRPIVTEHVFELA